MAMGKECSAIVVPLRICRQDTDMKRVIGRMLKYVTGSLKYMTDCRSRVHRAHCSSLALPRVHHRHGKIYEANSQTTNHSDPYLQSASTNAAPADRCVYITIEFRRILHHSWLDR